MDRMERTNGAESFTFAFHTELPELLRQGEFMVEENIF